MATKKQKREAAQAKRRQFLADEAERGQKTLQRSREKRERQERQGQAELARKKSRDAAKRVAKALAPKTETV